MNRQHATILAALMAVLPAGAGADTAKVSADIFNSTSDALVTILATYKDETGTHTIMAMGICIDPTGVFMTATINPRIRPKTIEDVQLVLPGIGGKKLKAQVLGVDSATELFFFRATEPHSFKVVRFSRHAKLSVGQQVISCGLMSPESGNVPYIGIAYVSTILRTPGQLVYVTGGRLTAMGSPVFTADGRAVGIVGQQLFLSYQTATARGVRPLSLKGMQETVFFMPVDEFVDVLENLPTSGEKRALPWIGVGRFSGVKTLLAEIAKLDRPGVLIGEVIPNQPAAEAGLQDRDIIVAMNGKPIEPLATPDLTAQNLWRKLVRMKIGQELTLTVLRDGKSRTFKLATTAMPTRPDEAKRYVSRQLGFAVREKVMLDKYIIKDPTANTPGVIVLLVGKKSPAEIAGLQVGDLVTNIAGQPVSSAAAVKQIVEAALAKTKAPGQVISVIVNRGSLPPKTINIELTAK